MDSEKVVGQRDINQIKKEQDESWKEKSRRLGRLAKAIYPLIKKGGFIELPVSKTLYRRMKDGSLRRVR